MDTARLKRRLPSDQWLSAKALMAAYKNNMQTGSLNNLQKGNTWFITVIKKIQNISRFRVVESNKIILVAFVANVAELVQNW